MVIRESAGGYIPQSLRRAGEWVLASVTRFLEEKLKLQVNRRKSGGYTVHSYVLTGIITNENL